MLKSKIFNKENIMKLVATNKSAYHEYFILSTIESGISLLGSEVKSIRLGHVNLKDSFITFSKGEAFIKNMHISNYKDSTIDKIDEKRSRKLLMHKKEIAKIISKTQEKGFTCVPLKIYFKDNKIKLEVAVAKGKHLYDKKKALAEKDIARDTQRELKNYR